MILRMNLNEVAPRYGNVHHLKVWEHTAPEFAVFVVLADLAARSPSG